VIKFNEKTNNGQCRSCGGRAAGGLCLKDRVKMWVKAPLVDYSIAPENRYMDYLKGQNPNLFRQQYLQEFTAPADSITMTEGSRSTGIILDEWGGMDVDMAKKDSEHTAHEFRLNPHLFANGISVTRRNGLLQIPDA